jgi:hypothetical protein
MEQQTNETSIQEIVGVIRQTPKTQIQSYLQWLFKNHYQNNSDFLTELIEHPEYKAALEDCLLANELLVINKILGLYLSYY